MFFSLGFYRKPLLSFIPNLYSPLQKRKKRRITKKNAKKKNVNRMFFSTSLGNGAKSTIIEAFIIYCVLWWAWSVPSICSWDSWTVGWKYSTTSGILQNKKNVFSQSKLIRKLRRLKLSNIWTCDRFENISLWRWNLTFHHTIRFYCLGYCRSPWIRVGSTRHCFTTFYP